jgi:hypothetical protein
MLSRTEAVSQVLLDSFQHIREQRSAWRQGLLEAGTLCRDSDLSYVPIPTVCGVDGSYAVERLLATDMVAAAAVAVEGITPPSETRFWPEPRHRVVVHTDSHDADTGTILRATMMGMELELALEAPHDVVLVDGSLTTPVIYFNQALNRCRETKRLAVTSGFLDAVPRYLGAYATSLASSRSDRAWVAIPKYTTRREIGQRLGWPEAHDDRAVLTNTLEAGEFTRPQPLDPPSQPWHLNTNPLSLDTRRLAEDRATSIVRLLGEIHILYYRPFGWLPALRLELGRAVAETPERLATVLHAVKHQCGAAAVLEPFPLYMADRMVKHLVSAIPTFRQIASQRLAETYEGDIQDIFIGMNGYRTEGGR